MNTLELTTRTQAQAKRHHVTSPAIYVGTYGKYNNGSIDGQWLSLDNFIDKHEFITACKSLHKDEPDAELMFQDWESIPECFINESGVDDAFWEYMAHDAGDDAKEAYIDAIGSWDAERFEEAFQGEYDNELAFTYQLVDDCGTLEGMPEFLQRYFDYESFSRDLFISDYTYSNGYVFRADL